MNLNKSTSCIATNESHYCTPFMDGIRLIVTKHTDNGTIKSYVYMRKNDGKCSKIKMELFPYIKGHTRQFKNKPLPKTLVSAR
jgi:hypothetical protein